MSSPVKINFKIYQGKTFREVLRWESSTKVYVPITDISKSAPVVVTAPNHLCPLGWRARVVGAGGMKEINSQDGQYYTVTSKTEDTVVFNSINSLQYGTYTSGGVLEYNQPVPLYGFSGKMQIRENIDGPVILELSSDNGQIVIDVLANTVTIQIPAEVTSTLNIKAGVYGLELSRGSEVVELATGNILLVREVTR